MADPIKVPTEAEREAIRQEYLAAAPHNGSAALTQSARDAAVREMWSGTGWIVGGVVFSGATYLYASGLGGTHLLFWGAVVYGLVRFTRGLSMYRQTRRLNT